MRKHAWLSGFIEDALLPTWRINYLGVFTNFTWHLYQLWMCASALAALCLHSPPKRRKHCSNTTVILISQDYVCSFFDGDFRMDKKEGGIFFCLHNNILVHFQSAFSTKSTRKQQWFEKDLFAYEAAGYTRNAVHARPIVGGVVSVLFSVVILK